MMKIWREIERESISKMQVKLNKWTTKQDKRGNPALMKLAKTLTCNSSVDFGLVIHNVPIQTEKCSVIARICNC